MDARPRKPRSTTLPRLGAHELLQKAMLPIKDFVSIYDGPEVFLRDLNKVGREQGLLWSARWCLDEVCNGGFDQFFGNSTGVLAPEAVQGFRMIRARAMVQITSRAMAMLGSPYLRDRTERGRALRKIRKPGKRREEWDPFYNLDEQVYALEKRGGFEPLAVEFIRRNMALFFK